MFCCNIIILLFCILWFRSPSDVSFVILVWHLSSGGLRNDDWWENLSVGPETVKNFGLLERSQKFWISRVLNQRILKDRGLNVPLTVSVRRIRMQCYICVPSVLCILVSHAVLCSSLQFLFFLVTHCIIIALLVCWSS